MQKVTGADGSTYWEYVFEKTTFEQDWDVPENTLAALGEALPLPQNGHAPMPEVHPPTPAPEPVPMAAKGAADARDGSPMAAPPPEKPEAIAVQSPPLPAPPTPEEEENERAIAGLREELARLPKPGGILRQSGRPIEGWVHAVAPPELTEYLRAMAGIYAAEAAMEAEKGRFMRAAVRWAWAAEYLVHHATFAPTREAIAALFLARAADWAYLAARGTPEMREAALLFAKAAEAVFFGKAAPSVLLEVLLETPLPTEYDPCLAGHYRAAVGYLVAAYWVLTGGDPKLLTKWLWPGRWERDDVEAMLLFSLGSEKRSVACAHLYLGDLPF